MPATSQKQEKFFNFVHAVQKGEASGKGYPKVEEAAKEVKPSSVEHFMGRGHIDKDLPKKACSVCGCGDKNKEHKNIKNKEHLKEAFDAGFIKAAIDNGVNPLTAIQLLKRAGAIPGMMMGGAGQGQWREQWVGYFLER